MTTVKTRFCPSPTGLVHLGNIRTALFNALLARQQSGTFLLRIEDTDLVRSRTEYVDALMEDLLWLGLDWQEGPNHEHDHGPYYQSQRQTVYDRFYHQLEQQKVAYPCFCSEEDLALMRKVQRAAGKPPRYPGTCFGLSEQEVNAKLQQGIKPTLRFHVPNDAIIEFDDAVRGSQKFSGNDIGDFIIRRADGTSPFMFCNAIDDALMGVTYALRGEDHLTNTPRQILILNSLNLPVPTYGHISLIVGPDGSPLSKRHGSKSVQELRKDGFFAEAINNYLARLGHYYEDDVYMSFDELAEKFSLDNLGRAPARFDYQQLLRWQQEVINRKPNDELWLWLFESTRELIPEARREEFIATIRPNILFPQDAQKYAELFFANNFSTMVFDQEHKEILQQAGTEYFETAIAIINSQGQDFKVVSKELGQRLNIKGKALFQPLRVAITGELHGPEMVAIFKLLSSDEIIARLRSAQLQFS